MDLYKLFTSNIATTTLRFMTYNEGCDKTIEQPHFMILQWASYSNNNWTHLPIHAWTPTFVSSSNQKKQTLDTNKPLGIKIGNYIKEY